MAHAESNPSLPNPNPLQMHDRPKSLSQSNLRPEIKNKLKLDLTGIKNPTQQVKASIKSEDDAPVGFHEEFMSKMEEFSLSWRQAAMQERKI